MSTGADMEICPRYIVWGGGERHNVKWFVEHKLFPV